MIDSGAACNLMSHRTWEKLGKPTLSSSKLNLIDFKGERSPAMGEILLKVQIQDQDMFIPFQVLPTNGCDWQLLLGRTWMQHTNLQIDWIKRSYQLQVSNSILHEKSAGRLDPPSTSVEEKPLTPLAPVHAKQVKVEVATTWISNETNQGHGWKVPTTLLKAQGYGKK